MRKKNYGIDKKSSSKHLQNVENSTSLSPRQQNQQMLSTTKPSISGPLKKIITSY